MGMREWYGGTQAHMESSDESSPMDYSWAARAQEGEFIGSGSAAKKNYK